MTINEPRGAAILATVMVAIGIGDMPYGYYTLLRLVLCCISAYLLFGVELNLKSWHR